MPYHDAKLLDGALRLIKDFAPAVIVQLGDLYDQFAFSKYARNNSATGLSPEQEHTLARLEAQNMWVRIRSENPKARLFQLSDANHDRRVVKRIEEKLPEHAFIAEDWLKRQMLFPGVRLVPSELVVDGVMFMHGMRKAGEHAKYNQMNTVTGHTHKARIEYMANINGPFWEMNTGWLGNKSAPVFAYRLQTRIDDTHSGIGLIEDRQPRFIAL